MGHRITDAWLRSGAGFMQDRRVKRADRRDRPRSRQLLDEAFDAAEDEAYEDAATQVDEARETLTSKSDLVSGDIRRELEALADRLRGGDVPSPLKRRSLLPATCDRSEIELREALREIGRKP